MTVENPLNSLFWLTSFMLKLFDKYPGHFTVLQHCMHGGTRDKKSKFWSYNPRKPDTNILESLGILCDGQHQHDSWKPRWVDGKLFFPTAEEAAYPTILCQRFASICVNEAKCRGLSPCQSLQQQLMVDPSVGKRNLFAAQSRGNKLKQILAEYGREATAAIPVGYQHTDKLLHEFPKAPTLSIVNCIGGLHGTNGGGSQAPLFPLSKKGHILRFSLLGSQGTQRTSSKMLMKLGIQGGPSLEFLH